MATSRRTTTKRGPSSSTIEYVKRRLAAIEEEIVDLRKVVERRVAPPQEETALYGILEGEDFAEEEIDEIGRTILPEREVTDG